MPSMARVTIVRNRRPRYVQSIRYYAVLRQMCDNPCQAHDRRCQRVSFGRQVIQRNSAANRA